MRTFAADASSERAQRSGILQTKAPFGKRGDVWEQEADRVASGVIRRPAHAGGTSPSAPFESSSSGTSLPRGMRGEMEARFGHDFSGVRVHHDDQTAPALGARAFTTRNDIFFAPGQYQPGSSLGRQLIAHELTHVVQQRAHGPMIQLAEGDSGAPGIDCKTLADSKTALNTEVNRRLDEARASAKKIAAIKGGAKAEPDPAEIVAQAAARLGSDANAYLVRMERWANKNLPHRGGGHGLRVRKGTKYENIPGIKGHFKYLAPIVKLNSVCLGTDKIGHMFAQGWQYTKIFVDQMLKKDDSDLAKTRAKAWGEYMEGSLSPATANDPDTMNWLTALAKEKRQAKKKRETKPEVLANEKPKPYENLAGANILGHRKGAFGLSATGVHSRGDLEANEAGLRFYLNLLRSPNLSFDIAKYVSPSWNEEVSGNIYSADVGAGVKKAGRLNPNDVVLPEE